MLNDTQEMLCYLGGQQDTCEFTCSFELNPGTAGWHEQCMFAKVPPWLSGSGCTVLNTLVHLGNLSFDAMRKSWAAVKKREYTLHCDLLLLHIRQDIGN